MWKKIFLVLLLFGTSVGFGIGIFETRVFGQGAAFASALQCSDAQKTIRVGISTNNFENYLYKETQITSTSEFKVIDKSINKQLGVFPANTKIKITITDNFFNVYKNGTLITTETIGPIAIIPVKTGLLSIEGLQRNSKTALYHGEFEITKSFNKFNQFLIVNILDLQNYLKGVVPNEMPVKFGLEALKAQSVAARNYALRPKSAIVYFPEFDICDSVACQVYFGANTQEALSDLAVAQTDGVVALYKDELILALYSSTSGGFSEDYKNTFSQNKIFPPEDIPYLRGKPDIEGMQTLDDEDDAREFYSTNPQTFDNLSPYFRWQISWDKNELQEILQNTIIKNISGGFITSLHFHANSIGNFVNIEVAKRGVSGKIIALKVLTDKNVFIIEKELTIRKIFTKDGKMLPSANVVFDVEEDDFGNVVKITAIGAGYGHGVGMSQYGAGFLASQNKKYDEILQHYYTDITLATIPIELTTDIGKDSASQTFFPINNYAQLVLSSKLPLSELILVINGCQLKIEPPNGSKQYRQDISEYLISGENKVTYFLPVKDAQRKIARVFVELKPVYDSSQSYKVNGTKPAHGAQ